MQQVLSKIFKLREVWMNSPNSLIHESGPFVLYTSSAIFSYVAHFKQYGPIPYFQVQSCYLINPKTQNLLSVTSMCSYQTVITYYVQGSTKY